MKKQNILWTGKPLYKAYLAQSILEFAGYLAFIGFCYAICYVIGIKYESPIDWWMIHVFAAIIIGQGFIGLIKKLLEYKNIEYRIFEDSVEIIRGVLCQSTKIIDKNKIEFFQKKSSLIEKHFNASTFKLYSGKVKKDNEDRVKKEYDKLLSIINLNDATEYLK